MNTDQVNFEDVLKEIKEDVFIWWGIETSNEDDAVADGGVLNREKSDYLDHINGMLYHENPADAIAEYIKWILGMGYDIMDAGYNDIVAYAQHLGIDVPSLIKEIADKKKTS